ncbi:hypothetical protein [Streptomyces sp. NPDC005408]|uniref:hypothetical protein n=1 Tax=Streptomyces sp. NPDC005408 TaxID=3155341 RepID=UPI0033B0BA34
MGDFSRMAYWAPLRYDHPLPDHRPDPLDGGPLDEGPPATEGVPAPVEFETPEAFVARTIDEARFDAGDVAPESVPGTGEVKNALSDWLLRMTYLGDTLAETEETGLGSQLPLEALPLPGSARKAVFRLLVKRTFKDVYAYFFGGAGAAIREVVRKALEGPDGAPLAMVGHSLGSIVAYEVLADEERDIELFATVGSPLAITEVQDHLAKPPAVPSGVRVWRNASDLRDLVALDHTLRPEYAPVERVTDLLVTNDSKNHHGISEYLGNPQVRGPFQRMFSHLA